MIPITIVSWLYPVAKTLTFKELFTLNYVKAERFFNLCRPSVRKVNLIGTSLLRSFDVKKSSTQITE